MNETTSVQGGVVSDLCMLNASKLNHEIYKDAFEHPDWEVIWEHDDPDGYRVVFCRPRTSAGQDPDTLCPPALIFRGSDSEDEDFAGLAMAYELNGTLDVSVPWPARNRSSRTPFAFSGSNGLIEEFNGKSMTEMRGLGLNEEKLFEAVTGTEDVFVDGPAWINADVTVEWTVSASLFYGLEGDWAVNFAQGLGKFIPEQYKKAIRDGKRAGSEAAAMGNRIMVTGHSLGGGLASAAGLAMHAQNADLVIRSDTYNAAGLHKNTAALADATLSMGGDIPIRARHVKDEILNSMQSTGRIVPFLADLLEWGGKEMPPAIDNPSPSSGLSPGAMSFTGQTYAPQSSRLPVLFTVNNQDLTPPLTELDDIINLANAATQVEDFVGNVIDHVVGLLSEGNNLTTGEVEDLQTTLPNLTVPDTFRDEVVTAILQGQTPPTLPFTGSTYITGHVGPLINRILVDSINLGRLLAASADYHTFPPCDETFLSDSN